MTTFNKGFEDLRVWQQAMDLAVIVYNSTVHFPIEEKRGLALQMRRAANSVASNIAEGCSRDGIKEFLHFLSIARGSLAELKTQAIIAFRVQLLNEEQSQTIIQQIDIVGRMINALRQSLRSDNSAATQSPATT